MSDITLAKKCFDENFRLFGSADTEKFNLYKGLCVLADAIGSMQAKLEDLDRRQCQTDGTAPSGTRSGPRRTYPTHDKGL